MATLRGLIGRFAGGTRRPRPAAGTGTRPAGGRPAGTRAQDEAIGRGIRKVLRRAR